MANANDPEILFNGTMSVDPIRVINPGGWYIGVRSPATGQVYPIMPDPTGTGQVNVGGTGTLSVTNIETGNIETFGASDLVVYQAATAFPQEPAETA